MRSVSRRVKTIVSPSAAARATTDTVLILSRKDSSMSACSESSSHRYTAPSVVPPLATGMAACERYAPSAKRDQNTCSPDRARIISAKSASLPSAESDEVS